MRMQHLKIKKLKLHANANCLSCLPIKDNNTNYDVVDAFQLNIEILPITITDLKTVTTKDAKLSKLYESLAFEKK